MDYSEVIEFPLNCFLTAEYLIAIVNEAIMAVTDDPIMQRRPFESPPSIAANLLSSFFIVDLNFPSYEINDNLSSKES